MAYHGGHGVAQHSGSSKAKAKISKAAAKAKIWHVRRSMASAAWRDGERR